MGTPSVHYLWEAIIDEVTCFECFTLHGKYKTDLDGWNDSHVEATYPDGHWVDPWTYRIKLHKNCRCVFNKYGG